MNVTARSCTQGAEWDELVGSIPWATAQHAFRYGQLLARCFGYLRPAYRAFVSGGRIVAGLPLVQFSPGGPFRAIHSLPFDIYGGPLIHPGHIDDPELHETISAEIDSEARRLGAFEARFSIPVTAPRAVRRGLELGAHVAMLSHDCPVLTLNRPLDEIRSGFQPSVRRALRRSAREGIVVEADADIAHVRRVYPFYQARMEQIRAAVKPWRFVEGILLQKLGVPFVAWRDGRSIGFLILLVTPGIAIYWISAHDPAAAPARPMNAMLDAAIGWSHGEGIPLFSFGESHGRPGLVRFKEGWGPGSGSNVVIIRTYRAGLQRTWRALQPVARRTYALYDRFRTRLKEGRPGPADRPGRTAE